MTDDDGTLRWICPDGHGEQASVAVVFDARTWFYNHPGTVLWRCTCGRECVPHQYGKPAIDDDWWAP